ncbi:peroxiredoxin-like family protein [Crocosphaera sp. UHCC 0190]|uniref:peroxiredoxin-like family protein n=1 Tax=Crocosphaera sp. UHCC 0190 TaxID=3110246 RepID=UPI002B21CA93|nr:peroxiredoxin-like family protein [Crocosphaera sp. UHCC 0190]MEA5510186.1 peroxiredoxin-like family protein [Crocosphaera sp. UHCC 0190]
MNIFNCLKQTQGLRVSDGMMVPILSGCEGSSRLLVMVWSQLGDFDTLEYAWWLQKQSSAIIAKGITWRSFAIGTRQSGLKFCDYTGFNREWLFVAPQAEIHQKLGLYQGLSWKIPGLNQSQNAWVNLMLMCAGIGSQGTLKEVFRGYRGDKKAPQLIADQEVIHAKPLPAIKGSFFKLAGGSGFQRPFELATIRLRNMTEVLSHWQTYVPNADYLTQRGGTFFFDAQGDLLYEHREKGILGFAENMSNPLSFLSITSHD